MSVPTLAVIIVLLYTSNVSGSPLTKDNAPSVSILEVQTSFVLLTVSGDTKINGSPVTSIEVSYTFDDSETRSELLNKKSRVETVQFTEKFAQTVNITGLSAGRKYVFTVRLVNSKGEKSKETITNVLLLPSTPSVEIIHADSNKLVLKWFGGDSGHEDYFLVNFNKYPFTHCGGLTLNVTVCFAMQHSFSDLQRSTLYRFTVKSHNPSGFSFPAVVDYPID